MIDPNEVEGYVKESSLGVWLIGGAIVVALFLAHREILNYLDSLLK